MIICITCEKEVEHDLYSCWCNECGKQVEKEMLDRLKEDIHESTRIEKGNTRQN